MDGLPKLYAIVNRATLDAQGVGVRAFAAELLEGGVRLLQYRDKANGPQEQLRAAATIAAVYAGTDAALILNDRTDLASLAGWGVHLGQDDLTPEDARRVLAGNHPGDAAGVLVGVSTHTDEQVSAAEAGVADYVAVGPVFRTSTKLDAEPMVGLDGVRRARARTAKPLVAIGGITLENARSVVDAGADSVAVIGGLLVKGRTMREVARDFLDVLR